MLLIHTVVFSILLRQSVKAFPSIAGSCRSGAGVGGTHIGDKNGTLTAGDAQLTVNGEILNEGDIIKLYSNNTNELMITGDFKGFLMKISGNSDELGTIPNAYGTLTVIDSENTQMLPRMSDSISQSSCLDTESGMSHTHNKLKNSISSNFMYGGEGAFTLEITIVTANIYGGNDDGWYYSPYQVSIEKPLFLETSAPVEEVEVEEIPESGSAQGGTKAPESSASCLVVGGPLTLFIATGLGLGLIFN